LPLGDCPKPLVPWQNTLTLDALPCYILAIETASKLPRKDTVTGAAVVDPRLKIDKDGL